MKQGETYHNDAGGVSEYNDFEAAMADEPAFGETVEQQPEADDSFSPERLEEVYPKGENESDEDYANRIAKMKEQAEAGGTSKLEEVTKQEEAIKENRKAAEELEKVFEARKARLDKKLEEGKSDVADIIGDGYQYDDTYKSAIARQNARHEAKLNELRSKIDAAVEAGEAAALLEKLREEDALEDAFEKSQTEERGLDGTKVGETKANAKELLKESYVKREAVIKEIEKLEKELDATRASAKELRGKVDDEKAKAKEGLDRVLEHIDAEMDNEDHKAKMREMAQKRYESRLEEIKAAHADEAEELRAKYAETSNALELKKKEKESITEDMEYINSESKKELKEIRERFDATVGTAEEGERYRQFFQERAAENFENLRKTGRLESQKEAEASDEEVVEGIAGADEAAGEETAGEKGDDEKSEGGKMPEKGNKTAEEFLEDLKKWRSEAMEDIEKRYKAALEDLGLAEPSADDEPKDIGDFGVNEYIEELDAAEKGIENIDLSGLSDEELAELEAGIDEQLEDMSDVELSDEDIRNKYKQAKYYVDEVKIEDDVPVEAYVAQLKRAFAGEDLSNDVWSFLEQSMRDRYDRVRGNQQRMREEKAAEASTPEAEPASEAAEKRPLNIEEGTEEYAKTPKGKTEILKGDIESARSAAEFIRNLDPEDVEGLAVYEVMDKVIRPKFFSTGFDTQGKTSKKYHKLMDKLSAKYSEYGLDARGEKVDTSEEASEKAKRKKVSKGIWKRLGIFRRGE